MGQILSMTGYGSASAVVNGQKFTLEIKSVNNRYLDCSVRLPRSYLFCEDDIRKEISGGVSRGKLDVYVSIDRGETKGNRVILDRELADGYYSAVCELARSYGLEPGLTAAGLASMPETLSIETAEIDREEASDTLIRMAREAVEDLNRMRLREGENLKSDILEKLRKIEDLLSRIEIRSPQIVTEYRSRMEERLRELLASASVDEQRLLTEAAIFADKTAVDEETVRLHSHIVQCRTMLDAGSPIGRKLDFLIQEFNREANTIGSKCNDAALASLVVDLKSEIEKVREQVQNIE